MNFNNSLKSTTFVSFFIECTFADLPSDEYNLGF